MNIQQLSTNIDHKLAQLDGKIRKLRELQQQPEGDTAQLTKDLAALEAIKRKLKKSQDIMWQAHSLQRDSDQRLLKQKRWLGIGLMVFSALGLLAILAVVIFR